MRTVILKAFTGEWALVVFRGFITATFAGIMWAASELVTIRDTTRDLQNTARELHAQIADIRQDANAAMKDAEQFRRASISAEAETRTKIQGFEQTLRALQDQVSQIWRKSQLEHTVGPT